MSEESILNIEIVKETNNVFGSNMALVFKTGELLVPSKTLRNTNGYGKLFTGRGLGSDLKSSF